MCTGDVYIQALCDTFRYTGYARCHDNGFIWYSIVADH